MFESIKEEVASTEGLSDYAAVGNLWTALIKIANKMAGKDEKTRIRALIDRIPRDSMRELLHRSSVDTLLNLDPPLETLMVSPHERLATRRAAREIRIVKSTRESDPRSAMISLVSILKRIRNKRVHGFKARGVSRDREILGAARPLILGLCHLGLEIIDPSKKPC